jgi:hypothetical protein
VLPDGITSIKGRRDTGGYKGAFFKCTNLTEVALPDTCIDIGIYTFNECSRLQQITLPNTLTGIRDSTFTECRRLRVVSLPDTVVEVGRGAFDGCTSLKEIAWPGMLATVGERAFNQCSSLQEVAFSDALISVGRHAFNGCINLREVVLPVKLAAIGDSAFDGCASLTTLFVVSYRYASSVPSASSTTEDVLRRRHAGDPRFRGGHPRLRRGDRSSMPVNWHTLLTTHLPHIARVWAPDAVVAALGGPFQRYSRYADLPPALQAAPARIQSWTAMELWRWWTPPDVAGGGATHHFHRLSGRYQAAVWTVLLVGERSAASIAKGDADGTVAVVPYGAVPVEIWMLIFGFCRRDVPMEHVV